MKDHTTAEIFEELWKRIEYDANVSEELASESNELQERINKAIEYIENNSLYEEEYDYDYEEIMYLVGTSDEVAKNDLLSILKGSDKDA